MKNRRRIEIKSGQNECRMTSHGEQELVAQTESQDEPLEGDNGRCEQEAVWRIMHRVRPGVLERRLRHGPLLWDGAI